MDEFQLISTFFQREYSDQQIICGSGDDAATIRPKSGYLLCVSTDTSIEGVHFLSDWDPKIIAQKAVAVNVSDMVAMAAIPKWASVALTISEIDLDWLSCFSEGLFVALDENNIALIGGDLTRGPLSITITIQGECLPNEATYRHGAMVGDFIYVTGKLGAPALAVDWLQKHEVDGSARVRAHVMNKLQKPKARTDCRQLISKFATSCIDISDGLVGDLGHVCKRSNVGANLTAEQIPIDNVVKQHVPQKALNYALYGGDEYQLCFTVSATKKILAEEFAQRKGLSIYPIGHIIPESGINLFLDGKKTRIEQGAYRHFV